MTEIFGKNTNKLVKNSNKHIYEYDRVALRHNYRNVTGTVLNVGDVNFPVYKVLLDKKFWLVKDEPKYVDLEDNTCFLLNKFNPNYYVCSSISDFINYCNQYDYHCLAH